jgi:DNA primase
MTSDLTHFIVAQLTELGLPVFNERGRSKNIATFCPFSDHDVDTPSLSIRKVDGRFYCFGCNESGHDWNELAERLKLDPLAEENLPDPFGILRDDLKEKHKKAIHSFKLPWDIEDFDGRWRHVGQYTLDALDTFLWYDDMLRCERILIPVYMYQRLKGWVSRRLDRPKDGVPYKMKYRNAPYMEAKDLLFPYDVVEEMGKSSVVLVEGPYDAVRLINCDIPALAILGTNNWKAESRIDLINLGVERVIVAMDNDTSGRKARAEIIPDLEDDFDVEGFFPPSTEGKNDPGAMPYHPCVKKLWRVTR